MNSNRVELQVSANTTSSTVAGGFVDLYGDEDITINYAIKDIRDFASTTSTYSQNFKVPGTKNNNILFQNLFLVGANGQFDPRKKALCTLTVDSVVIMEGYLQVVSIDVNDRDKPEYNVTIFSNVKGFNSAIKGKYLTDYEWSGMNHTLNVNSITNTWSGNAANPGYFYSIKDYGYDYTITGVKGANNKEGIPIGNMWPDVYNKRIIDTIMQTEGYSYDSSFLSSATFQNTVIPFCGDADTVMGADYLSARTFVSTETTLSSITFNQMRQMSLTEAITPYTYEYKRRLRGNYIISGSAGNYTQNTPIGDYYTFDQPGISQFSYSINYEAMNAGSQINMPLTMGVNFYRSTYNGGLIPFHHDEQRVQIGAGPSFLVFTTPMCNNTNGPTTFAGQTYKPFSQGEQVWVELWVKYDHGYVAPTMSNIVFKITDGGLTWKHFPSTQRTVGQNVDMNNIMPQKMLVTDYLKSIFNMFNLYMMPSKTVPNRFTIEDFESFYAAGTQRNWSTKLDRSQTVTETLITEFLAKKYTFKYKEDKDFLNEDYKTKLNRTYGDWWYDTDNDFITQEEDVELIFSPTPCDNIIGSSNFIIPKIGKYDNNGKFGKTNFNTRILQKSTTPLTLPTGEYWRFTGTTTYNTYPYVGHLNHPLTGTTDINFGSVPYVYYPFQGTTGNTMNRITENNLINTYWKKYLDEVSDEDAKLITAYFKLTPKDIFEFNFNDTVYVEGITSEGGHVYRVNSIAYSTDPSKLSKVELIKVLTKYVTKFPSRRQIFGLSEVGIGHVGLSLGGAQVLHRGSIGVGNGTIVWGDNAFAIGNENVVRGNGSSVFGDINVVGAGATGVTVFGSNNYIDDGAYKSTIIGDNNSVLSGALSTYIRGDRNSVVLGNQIVINGYDNLINTGGTSYLTENITVNGIGNVLYGQTTGATVTGNYNVVSGETINITIFGHSNSASTSSSAVTINGNYNRVNTGSNNIVINGYSNVISANTNNVTILGVNNLTTTLSDIVYAPSVEINNNFYLATGSTIAMGEAFVLPGTLGVALGSGGTVTAEYGTAVGNTTEVTMVGEFAMASDGNYGQAGTVMLQNQTVNAQAVELYTQISTTSRFTIASGTSYFTRLYAVATDITNQNTIAYEGAGVIANKSGTTSLLGPILMKAVNYDAYMSATSLSVSANTSNSSLIVTASGQTNTTINWICQVDYTKVNQII